MEMSSFLPTTNDERLKRQALQGLENMERVIEVAQTPVTAKKTAVYSASILLAAGDASMTGRKFLRVKNVGNVQAVVGPTSTAKTPSAGDIIDPGYTVTYKFTGAEEAPVDLYARSLGYPTDLEVTEG